MLLNFSILGGKRKHGYKLNIPENTEYHFSNFAYNNENPVQFYLQHLLSEIISEICGFISEYSYHTNNHSTINLNSENSKNFIEWISEINKNKFEWMIPKLIKHHEFVPVWSF